VTIFMQMEKCVKTTGHPSLFDICNSTKNTAQIILKGLSLEIERGFEWYGCIALCCLVLIFNLSSSEVLENGCTSAC
jgi:hypothetical protein